MVGTNEEGGSNSVNQKQIYEALTADMGRLIAEQFEAFKLESLRQELRPSQPTHESQASEREIQRQREPRRQPREAATHDYYSTHSLTSQRNQRRTRRDRDGRDRLQENLNGLKIKIPAFHGQNDPEEYLEWEKKMEIAFNCHEYTEESKVKVAPTEFTGYALSWWDQLTLTRKRVGDYPVETWTQMKKIMRKRFVPSHHHRELHHRLRNLAQGNRSVEEYFQELETLMLRAHISEDREATMSRFLRGLNREIQDRVEMQHYDDLEEMLHKAILVEQQVKRRGVPRSNYGAELNRMSYQREGKQIVNPKPESKPFTTSQEKGKEKKELTSTRTRDLKCFRCQGRGHYASECTNKRIIIVRENGEIESEDETGPECEENAPIPEDCEEKVQGQLLVARRSLSIQGLNQSLESPKEATTRELGGFTQVEAVLFHPQLPGVEYSIVTKKKPPDASPPIKTRGNYLDSQKRMKPNLLSIGTGQTDLSTKLSKKKETDVESKPSIYQNNERESRRVPTDLEQALHHGWTPTIILRARERELELAKVSIVALNNPFIPEHTDMIRLSLSKEPNTCFRAILERTRRTEKREEDKRFKPPDLDQDKLQDVSCFILIQEEPPDPAPLSFTVMSTEHTKDFIHVSHAFSPCVSHDLRVVCMSLICPEIIENELGLIKEQPERNYCLKKQVKYKHDNDNPLNQNEISLVVFGDSMTVLIHLLFGKGVENIAGIKEEPPDIEDLSSNVFERTGIGVILTTKLNTFQRSILVEITKRNGRRFCDAESLLKSHDNINHPLDLQGKYDVSPSSNVSDLIPFVADETDLRSNLFQEGGDDKIMEQGTRHEREEAKPGPEDKFITEPALAIPSGPMTRSRTRQLCHDFGASLRLALAQADHSDLTCLKATLVTIHAREG